MGQPPSGAVLAADGVPPVPVLCAWLLGLVQGLACLRLRVRLPVLLRLVRIDTVLRLIRLPGSLGLPGHARRAVGRRAP